MSHGVTFLLDVGLLHQRALRRVHEPQPLSGSLFLSGMCVLMNRKILLNHAVATRPSGADSVRAFRRVAVQRSA